MFSDEAILFDTQESVWLGASPGNRFGGICTAAIRSDWPTPDFSTLSIRQQTLNVQMPYTRSQAGLHMLVDSTGVKFIGEGEWKRK